MTPRNRCLQCSMRSMSLCGEVSEDAAAELSRLVHRMRVPEGRLLYGEHQMPKTFSIILSGVVKIVTNRPDGRQQIVGLQFPSDFVGRPYTDTSSIYAEAATDLELCTFSGKAFEDLLIAHRDVERALLRRVLNDLDAAREWMFLLGRKTAEEKVASFLAMISDRLNAPGGVANLTGAPALMKLPLSRTEIAECLSLRLETVSRQFAVLKGRGIVETSGRRSFLVNDMAALKRYGDNQAAHA